MKKEETEDESKLLARAENATPSNSAPLLHVENREGEEPQAGQPSNHPKKGTRLIFDCVLVWRRADLQRHKEKESEKDLQMMKAIKNVRQIPW